MSCKFKRQIKRFEKLRGQGYAYESPLDNHDSHKPTFFFGDLARAKLVCAIEGDVHFDNLTSSIEDILAEQEEEHSAKVSHPTLSADQDGISKTEVLSCTELKHATGEC